MLSKSLYLSLLPLALCSPITTVTEIVATVTTTDCPSSTPAAGSSATSSSPSGQIPFSFPLPNGFPNVEANSSALMAIEKQAHGTLPNGKLASEISNTSTTVFEVIAFNEIFEVAFFTSLIQNITNDVTGYQAKDYSPYTKETVLNILETIQAQEELHALGANGILSTAGRQPVQPCQYVFPTADFSTAIAFASTFTDVVLGVLQEAQADLCLDGDAEYIGLLGSVIGQEGEQDGWFRFTEKKVPSALPFLTAASAAWGYSVLNQLVVVPGSCPTSPPIGVPIFKPLTVATMGINENTTSIQYSIESSTAAAAGYHLVYTNQQNVPVVMPLQNVQSSGSAVTFSVDFPYAKYELNGLTIAAITNSAGPFANATEVASATVFGPGLIEVN